MKMNNDFKFSAAINILKNKNMIQILDNSCVSACISALLDVDQQAIINEFHEGYSKNVIRIETPFYNRGILYKKHYSDSRDIYKGHVHMLSVPSLNIRGGHHSVVGVSPYFDESIHHVFDPNRGRGDRQYYVDRLAYEDGEILEIEEFQCHLNGFCIDISISIDTFLDIHNFGNK